MKTSSYIIFHNYILRKMWIKIILIINDKIDYVMKIGY